MDKVSIRRVVAADQPALVAFYAGLSPESRRARFLGCTAGIGAICARAMCAADHIHEEGFVALAAAPAGKPIVVGHVCMICTREGRTELAIAVADAYQGLGVGRRLFRRAVAWARHSGLTSITATAFTDNWRVIQLLGSARQGITMTPADAGVIEVAFTVA
jgi:acetyltransferase